MRIDTDLTDQDREAVKVYADANNLTMKGAYTQLLRDALFTRTSLTYLPDKDNIGIAWDGYDSRIRTNVGRERFIDTLLENPDTWFYLYAPRKFAALEAYGDIDYGESFFDTRHLGWTEPKDGEVSDDA